MFIAIILILVAVALFLIFHDDHDDSYTRSERSGQKSLPKKSYQKKVTRRTATFLDPKTVVPKEKQFQSARAVPPEPKRISFAFLDRINYDKSLPEITMSSFIAGLQGYCTKENLGGVVGYVMVDPVTGALEVHDTGDGLMGYLPMKDRAAYSTFNPGHVLCPFAGHIGISTTGRYYADIRIVLPSSRPFVEDSLRGFLG